MVLAKTAELVGKNCSKKGLSLQNVHKNYIRQDSLYSMMILWSWGIHFCKGSITSLHVKFMILNPQLLMLFLLEISANVISLHNLIVTTIWAWGLLFIKKKTLYNLKNSSWIITNKMQVYSFAFAEIFLM